MRNEFEDLPSTPINHTGFTSIDKGTDVNKLIEEAVEPRVWKDHVVKDLMKFWDTAEATTLHNGLFRTYITNAGKTIPENPEDWPDEYKAALKLCKGTFPTYLRIWHCFPYDWQSSLSGGLQERRNGFA